MPWELNFSSVLKAYSGQSLEKISIWRGEEEGQDIDFRLFVRSCYQLARHRLSWFCSFFKDMLRFFQVLSWYRIFLMQSHQLKFIKIKSPYFKTTKLYFQIYAENKNSGPFVSNTISHKPNVWNFMRPLSERRADKGWNASNSAIFPLPSLTNSVPDFSHYFHFLHFSPTAYVPSNFLIFNGLSQIKKIILSFLRLLIYTIRRMYILLSSDIIWALLCTLCFYTPKLLSRCSVWP